MTERFPFAALMAALGTSTVNDTLRRCGIRHPYKTPLYVERGLSALMADRLAVGAGLHPFEVWPAMADAADAERRAKVAARMRRYRARNAHAREANREQMRRYYAECGDYVRAQQRRRYWANPERERARKRARRQAA